MPSFSIKKSEILKKLHCAIIQSDSIEAETEAETLSQAEVQSLKSQTTVVGEEDLEKNEMEEETIASETIAEPEAAAAADE